MSILFHNMISFFGNSRGLANATSWWMMLWRPRLFGTKEPPISWEIPMTFIQVPSAKHFLKGRFSYWNTGNLCGIRNLQFDFFYADC